MDISPELKLQKLLEEEKVIRVLLNQITSKHQELREEHAALKLTQKEIISKFSKVNPDLAEQSNESVEVGQENDFELEHIASQPILNSQLLYDVSTSDISNSQKENTTELFANEYINFVESDIESEEDFSERDLDNPDVINKIVLFEQPPLLGSAEEESDEN